MERVVHQLVLLILIYSATQVAFVCCEEHEHEHEHEHEQSTRHVLSCRFCGARVAEPLDIFYREAASTSEGQEDPVGDSADSGDPLTPAQALKQVSHRLVNKHKTTFDVVAFRNATVGVEAQCIPSDSWFPGYSWRIAFCPKCGVHVGWKFVRNDRVQEGKEVEDGEVNAGAGVAIRSDKNAESEGTGEEEEEDENPPWFFGLVLDRLVFKSVLDNIVDNILAI